MKKILFIFTILTSILIFSGCMSTIAVPSNLPTDNRGNLEVVIQDQFTEIIDLKVLNFQDNLTLINNFSQDSKIIEASTTGYIPIVNDIVCLKDKDGTAFYQGEVLNVNLISGNTYSLTLDTPLDFDFEVGDGCSIGKSNWAVDGSINPVTFSVSPKGNLNTTSWDITRILFLCTGDGVSGSDSVPDGTSFFTTDAITKGIYLKVDNGKDKNIFNAKTNNDLTLRMYDLNIDKNPNKNGLYTVAARRTFSGKDKNGVTIRLNENSGDSFNLVVQDDLTDMAKCEAVVQGHIVE